MLWLLLGCASHRISLPMEAVHHGPVAPLPVLPLQSVWVEAVDDSCAAVVDGFRFAWTVHAGQLVHPDAKIRLNIQNCGVDLQERVQIDPYASLAADADQLDVLLTGRGWATVFVETEDSGVLDVIRVQALTIERQRWVGGQRYAWRDPLSVAVEWALVEELEAGLLPLASLRAPINLEALIAVVGAID